MHIRSVSVILLWTFASVLWSCGDEVESVTARDKLQLIARLNRALGQCSDLSTADSIAACATVSCGQILQDLDVSAATRKIWGDYAKANALASKYNGKATDLINEGLRETEDYGLLFERAQFLSLRAYINSRFSDRQFAVYDAYQAANIYVELGLPDAAAVSYLNIANVQYKAGNQQIAIENALQSVKLYSESSGLHRSDSLWLLNAHNTLGMSYAYLQDYASAAKHYDSALGLAAKMHHELWTGIITGSMATLDISKGNYAEAWAKQSENIRVGLKFNELASAGFALMGQAEILMKEQQFHRAKLFYDSAWNLMRKEWRPEIWVMYFKNMSAWYEAVGAYDSANANYKRYIAFRDSTQGVLSSQLLHLQNQIQFEKQLGFLRVENNLKKSELTTSYLIIVSFIVILILILLLLYNLRRSYRNINALNAELEDKVRERTLELRRLNKELDTYLYRASHDVRRPILSIIGLGRLAGLARDDNERKEIQQKIDITARDMDRMLSKIRMAYELDKHEDVQDVNINVYLSSLLENFENAHPEVVFSLGVGTPAVLYSSPSLLDVVFVNVIENACTFKNPMDPWINVTVATQDNCVHVSVKDNGIGIDSNHLKSIFDPYTRYSDRSVGSGLGLHLTRKAVLRLKGTISVESTLYAGSEFRIVIPYLPG